MKLYHVDILQQNEENANLKFQSANYCKIIVKKLNTIRVWPTFFDIFAALHTTEL